MQNVSRYCVIIMHIHKDVYHQSLWYQIILTINYKNIFINMSIASYIWVSCVLNDTIHFNFIKRHKIILSTILHNVFSSYIKREVQSARAKFCERECWCQVSARVAHSSQVYNNSQVRPNFCTLATVISQWQE